MQAYSSSSSYPILGGFRHNHRMEPPPLSGGGPTSSADPTTTMFNVHWDDFNRVVVDSLWTLLTEESLTDCTLVVSPSEHVQVHRVVLSANSPYFRSLLHAHSQQPNPIIILQDISYATLKMLVMFMYRGQVSVNSEEMSSLLKAAEHLQIIGLTQTTRRSPINLGPVSLLTSTTTRTTPTPTSADSPLPINSSSSSSLCGESQSQVYSKKSRILDQSKVNTAIVSSSSAAHLSTTAGGSNPHHLHQGHRDFRTEPLTPSSRGIELTERDPLGEQHSPLSLKKEEGSESNDLEEKYMEMEHISEQSPLCLRYCCPYCSTNFTSQTSLSRHIMVHHPTVYSALYDPHHASTSSSSSSQPPSVGGSGGPTLIESPLSTPHIPSSPPDNNHILLDGHEEVGEGNTIICKFCGKPFPEVTQLIQHLPIHTGERPFKCEFCGKAFKLRHHMKDHARVHTGERPFRCGYCGKNFSRSTILKAHEKTHFPKGSAPPGGSGSNGNGTGSGT